MAAKKKLKKVVFPEIKKLFAAVALISCMVLGLGGIQAGVRPITTIYRAIVVVFVILIIVKVVIRILKGYEEMSGGKS